MVDREGITRLNDDVLHNILARLPALSFAAAACVNKTWHRVSAQILFHPKLVSALSLNPSIMGAVDEVLDKVLCKPIRPDFAIACISDDFGLKLAHQLLTQKLGARTPLVTHISNGVMGMDALTYELKEVQWEYFDYSHGHPREYYTYGNANQGMVLVVGYLPGLKIEAIPLFHPKGDHEITTVDYAKFISEIKAYTAAVSRDEFPAVIMMFGDLNSDVNSFLANMDHAMPKETTIIGDGGGCFVFNSLNYTITTPCVLDAVALVFAKDQNKSLDVGETQFHVVMAGELVQFEPQLEVIDVEIQPEGKSSWLSMKSKNDGHVFFMIEDILEIINEEFEVQTTDLYIAVSQPRSYNYTESSNLAFYQVTGGEGSFLHIDGIGIKPGDSFEFYHRDLETAKALSVIASNNLKILKENTCDNGDVFGGLVFSCHSRGESYFGHPNFETIPFALNFPGVPIAGMFCKGEIGRGSSHFIKEEEHKEQCHVHYCRHVCSAVYFFCLIIILNLCEGLDPFK